MILVGVVAVAVAVDRTIIRAITIPAIQIQIQTQAQDPVAASATPVAEMEKVLMKLYMSLTTLEETKIHIVVNATESALNIHI
jgi:hypothetical protein